MLHFDLNISIRLPERPFLDRIDEACRLQFDTVEFRWPANVAPAQLAARIKATGLPIVAPDGRLMRFIPMPVDPDSNVGFGGPEWRNRLSPPEK